MTLQEVKDALSKVKHPAIDNSLVNLGIVSNIDLVENTVSVVFAFPFPNIPIAEQLVASIENPVKEMGLEFEHMIRGMTDNERALFMQLEQEGWIG
jgi:ATP-binding protein involved in chromosome partitioning